METDAPVLDLGGHGHEGLLNIGGILCTGLQEGNPNLISKSLQVQARTIGAASMHTLHRHCLWDIWMLNYVQLQTHVRTITGSVL